MFLDVDKRNASTVAAIDDDGLQMTYGDLSSFCVLMKDRLETRKLAFILAENSIGSFAGYISMLSNKVVPLILDSKMEKDLLGNLITMYRPYYYWVPSRMKSDFRGEVIFEDHGYALLQDTENRDATVLYADLALLLPTSGSTGSSKLVRHSYRNIEASARNVSQFFEFTDQDRGLVTLPMYYTMGLSVITSHIYVGATILLTKKSLTDALFWTFLKEQRATSFTGVPYSFEVLSRLCFFRMKLPDLRVITQGGGKMREDLFQACAEYAETSGKKFIATYGQTEGTARMAYLPAELATRKICSIGYAVPHGELYLINEDKEILTDKEATGQLVYKGENVTLGYACCREDLEKGDERDGILYTGDLARRDADGCYYIVGRMGRFLKLYGSRVGLDECENMIKSALGIECACVGDDECMLVYITERDYLGQVLKLLEEKTRLIASAFKGVIIDAIPKNETGKVLYSQLKTKN